jgi:hypothetical protein
MIGDTWANLSVWLAPFADNTTEWVTLFVLIFAIVPFIDAISQGDISQVEADIRKAWGFFIGIFTFAFNLISRFVGWILEAIPL